MRVLGLDVGERRIGVAVSDALGLTAQQVTVLERWHAASDIAAVCALAKQHAVTQVVVGLPLTLKGERGPQAQRVMKSSHSALNAVLPASARQRAVSRSQAM